MKPITKIKLKLVILDIIFELFVNSVILSMAYLSSRLIETLFFYVCWKAFRYAVPKLFHVRLKSPLMSLIGCALCSCSIFFISTKIMLPIGVSIFSSVIVGMGVNYLLYKTQDYLELKQNKIDNLEKLYTMTEEELRDYARSKQVSEQIIDTLVLRVKYNYRWVDIQREKIYTKDGIKYHREVIEKKLNIKL